VRTTKELYLQDAKLWADLPYREALKMRIELAKKAMTKYRLDVNEEGYIASEKAVAWNRELLKEVE
jgi:hypothetical protein